MGSKFALNDLVAGPRLRTREDLLAQNVPETSIASWLRSGRLHIAFDGVYVVGHPSLTREERWLAAVLACGPGAALSHQSAAVLWKIVTAEGWRIDVSVPRGRHGQPGIQPHRRRHPPHTTTHRDIPVTTIAQTLVDLAATFEPKYLERAYTEAQLSPFFSRRELLELLEQPHKEHRRPQARAGQRRRARQPHVPRAQARHAARPREGSGPAARRPDRAALHHQRGVA